MMKPDIKFHKETKAKFLAAFDARYGSVQPAWRWSLAIKSLAGAFAALAILLGGFSVYADTKNVPADNLLYPFKILTEKFQLAVTPPAEQPQLQATFAARRVAELSDIETRNPTSTLVATLAVKADAAVNASIADADKADLNDGNLVNLCGSLFSTIATSSVTLHGEIKDNSQLFQKFEDKCDSAFEPSASTSTFPAAAAAHVMLSAPFATSTPTTTPKFRSDASSTVNIESRLRNYLIRHFPPSFFPSDENGDGEKGSSTTVSIGVSVSDTVNASSSRQGHDGGSGSGSEKDGGEGDKHGSTESTTTKNVVNVTATTTIPNTIDLGL